MRIYCRNLGLGSSNKNTSLISFVSFSLHLWLIQMIGFYKAEKNNMISLDFQGMSTYCLYIMDPVSLVNEDALGWSNICGLLTDF